MKKVGLGVDIRWLGRVKVEDKNGRGDGKKAIAERRNAAHLTAGQRIVTGLHHVTIAFSPKRVNPSGDLVIVVGNASLLSAI
jgi:hypothetical protein